MKFETGFVFDWSKTFATAVCIASSIFFLFGQDPEIHKIDDDHSRWWILPAAVACMGSLVMVMMSTSKAEGAQALKFARRDFCRCLISAGLFYLVTSRLMWYTLRSSVHHYDNVDPEKIRDQNGFGERLVLTVLGTFNMLVLSVLVAGVGYMAYKSADTFLRLFEQSKSQAEIELDRTSRDARSIIPN